MRPDQAIAIICTVLEHTNLPDSELREKLKGMITPETPTGRKSAPGKYTVTLDAEELRKALGNAIVAINSGSRSGHPPVLHELNRFQNLLVGQVREANLTVDGLEPGQTININGPWASRIVHRAMAYLRGAMKMIDLPDVPMSNLPRLSPENTIGMLERLGKAIAGDISVESLEWEDHTGDRGTGWKLPDECQIVLWHDHQWKLQEVAERMAGDVSNTIVTKSFLASLCSVVLGKSTGTDGLRRTAETTMKGLTSSDLRDLVQVVESDAPATEPIAHRTSDKDHVVVSKKFLMTLLYHFPADAKPQDVSRTTIEAARDRMQRGEEMFFTWADFEREKFEAALKKWQIYYHKDFQFDMKWNSDDSRYVGSTVQVLFAMWLEATARDEPIPLHGMEVTEADEEAVRFALDSMHVARRDGRFGPDEATIRGMESLHARLKTAVHGQPR